MKPELVANLDKVAMVQNSRLEEDGRSGDIMAHHET
jgi:hypothetical protein